MKCLFTQTQIYAFSYVRDQFLICIENVKFDLCDVFATRENKLYEKKRIIRKRSSMLEKLILWMKGSMKYDE